MLTQIIIASVIISSISLIGGIFLVWKKLLTEKFTSYWVSFAAGVMLVTAFLDLLPEALEESKSGNIFLPALIGIVLFFFMERFMIWFHHHDHDHHAEPSSILILFGDGLHNVFDGIAIAAAFLISPAVGVTTTLAIAAHEIPHEIADFSILIHGGMSKSKALFYNFLSALTSLGGALVGYFYLSAVEEVLPLFLSLSAGMFIYIACSDLIPDMHQDFKKQKGWIQSVPFLIGMILMGLMIKFLEG